MPDVGETIEVRSRRIGRHAWVEMRLFETLGRWSGTVPDARARALLARQSHHHAWHAELWHDLLPALPHLPRTELVVPEESDAALVARLDALDTADSPVAPDAGGADRPETGGGHVTASDPTVARLEAVYDLALPHLAAVYTDHLAHTTPVADAPTTRVLCLIQADLAEDRSAGDALLADLRTAAVT